MGKTVRTVRFDEDESAKIEEFLKRNPLFDFSSLARTAIVRFIHNPDVKITGLKTPKGNTALGRRGDS